jgi:PAS domain S-box-containing protein
MFLDVNERKKAEEVLRRSEEKYRELANCLPEIVFETDMNGQLVFANERAAEISGYSLSEIEKGLNILQFIAPEDRERGTKIIQRLLAGGGCVPAEYTFVRKDGTTFPALITATPRISENAVTGLRGLVIDITERKKVMNALRESEEKYRRQFEEALDAIFVADAETGILVDCNPAACELVGRAKSEIVGMHQRILHPPEKNEGEFSRTFKEHIGKKKRHVLETQVITKSGEIKDVAIKANTFTLGNKTLMQGSFRDITERKKTEAALRQSEERYRSVFENSIDGVIISQPDGSILSANPVACRMLGMSEEELKKAGRAGIVIKDEKLTTALQERERTGQARADLTFRRKDGTTFVGEVSIGVFTDAEGIIKISLIFRDVTERKKAEKQINQLQDHLQLQVDRMPIGLIVWDLEFRAKTWNPAATKIFGFPEKEALGKHPYDFIVPKQAQPYVDEIWRRLLKGDETAHSENENLTKDGRTINCTWSNTPLKKDDGTVIGVLSIIQDITERKEAEEKLDKLMNELVLVNEKLGVVGSLTRHDVRNKLSAVTGYAYLLKKKHADQADVLDGVSRMEQAVKEIAAIFDFAKMYEQLGVEELKYINTEKALNEATALFSGSSSLEFINDCHGLSLLADSLLTQLFYNLIDNSLKHGEKVTKIRVHYEKADQDELIVVFEDDGVGISAENKPKLFREGFSTSGTSGYGLFLMRKMMGVYGWSIQENGEPGKGAKFTMTIPRINQNGKENFQIA